MAGIAILGFGVVGSGVSDMLIQNKDVIERAAGCPMNLTHVVELREVPVPAGVRLTKRFEDVVESEDVRIVVETIGGSKVAYDFTKRALMSGRHVVTSNKELVAGRGDELVRIAQQQGVMYLYEASVGGGIPVIRPMTQCLTGNRITRIDGIVNGSTNYLLSRMAENGVSFPAALGEAKHLGYVEENPAADIEGWDARRKLAILANAAFGSRFGDDIMIPTEGISGITEEDIASARTFGAAVKLIAHAERDGEHWHGWVHPAAVMPASPLYNVRQAYNAILVHGDFVDDVMFYGPGAGSHPTASAVVGDVIDAAQHLSVPKRRLDFPDAPCFRLKNDASNAQYITCALPGEGVRSMIEEAIPGTDIRESGTMLAIMTPVGSQNELIDRLNRLSAQGVRFGSMLYVIGARR